MFHATTSPKQTLTAALESVQGLDLERITRKVQHQRGWTASRANQAERDYRRYLALLLVYPDRPIAPPGQDADEIWHGHILDTVAYARDCERLFGCFLHHVPSYGKADEKLLLASAREQSEALYQRHFGTEQDAQENQDEAETTAGCVPCFGERNQRERDITADAGCVPCFARQPKPEESAFLALQERIL